MRKRITQVVSSASWLNALLLLLLLGATPCFAQTGNTNYLTSTTADLQAALDGGGNIVLQFNGTMTTQGNYFDVATDVILDGSTNSVIISGNGTSVIFVVEPGVTFQVRNLAMVNGKNAGLNGNNGAAGSTGGYNNGGNGFPGLNGHNANGGAIYNEGITIVTNCLFISNSVVGGNGGNGGAGGSSEFTAGNGGNGGNGGSASGAAIYNLNTLVVSNCTFAANTATGGNGGVGGTNGAGSLGTSYNGAGGPGGQAAGAAIYSAPGASVVILACSFFDNITQGGSSQAATTASSGNGQTGPNGAGALGGAVYNANSTIVVNSTFFENFVYGGNGGGGGNAVGSGGVDAGIGGNGGNGWGGAIYNESTGTVAVTNCTFDGGQAWGGTNGPNGSGGFTNGSGSLGLGYGANIANHSGKFTIANSIIAYPTNALNAYGTFTDGGYNISSDGTPTLTPHSNNYVNPLLLNLANNGGPTETIGIPASSPARDRIPPSSAPTLDQRGFPRPLGTNTYTDIGAYEFGTPQYTIAGEVGTPTAGLPVYAYGTNSTHLVFTDANGNYAFTNLITGVYTIAPFPTNGFSYSPPSQLLTNPPNAYGVDFTATAAYVAGGIVSNVTSSVTLDIYTTTNGNNTFVYQTTSSAIGIYNFTNLPPGNYTIIPQANATYAFSPQSLPVTVPPTSTNYNFVGVPPTYTIAGQIASVTAPVEVVVTIGSSTNLFGSALTDNSGNYSFSSVPAGTYAVTPQPTNGYTYTPPTVSVTVPPTTNTLDFTASSSPTFALSGQISNLRKSVGIMAISSTSTNSVLTDANGNYSFLSLSSGNYTVVPQSMSGITFHPSSINVLLPPAATSQNFAVVTTSKPSITGPHLSGDQFSFSIVGTADVVYRIQVATNLSGPWETISTNTTGSSGSVSVTNIITDYPQVYFRAVTP